MCVLFLHCSSPEINRCDYFTSKVSKNVCLVIWRAWERGRLRENGERTKKREERERERLFCLLIYSLNSHSTWDTVEFMPGPRNANRVTIWWQGLRYLSLPRGWAGSQRDGGLAGTPRSRCRRLRLPPRPQCWMSAPNTFTIEYDCSAQPSPSPGCCHVLTHHPHVSKRELIWPVHTQSGMKKDSVEGGHLCSPISIAHNARYSFTFWSDWC